ncbi:MAG: putative transposase [Oceanicoccus sp.]|jgi:putative transposase
MSNRAIEDRRLLTLIQESDTTRSATYGSPWIHRDLREANQTCSVHRVAKIMRDNKLRAQIGYKRRYINGGKHGKITDNILARQFNPDAPNQAWGSDITYVRSYEGFLYVATVLDLFSRRIVGWSMDKTMDRHLVINALMMAVWQRRGISPVIQ